MATMYEKQWPIRRMSHHSLHILIQPIITLLHLTVSLLEGLSSTVQPSSTEFAHYVQPTERLRSDSVNDIRKDDGAGNLSVPPPAGDVSAGSHASSPPSPASDHSSPSEDLTQSKIFSHEEAESMYMSAVSHASMSKKDKSASIPGNWGSSDSESEDEGRIASFLEEPSTSQHHKTSSMDRYSQKSGFGISSHLKQAEPNQSNTFSSSRVHKSLNPITDDELETEPSTPPAQRKAASSHGSQLSSTNLKASFTVEKRVITVDSIVLEVPQAASPPSNSPLEDPTSRPTRSSEVARITFVEPSNNLSEPTNVQESQQSGRPLTIDVGNIQVLGDMALTRMTIIIAQQLNALRKKAPHKRQRRNITESPPFRKNHLRLKINKACWKFLDMVKSTTVSSARQHEMGVDPFSQNSEVLLRAEIDSCLAVHNDPTSSSIFKFSMGKFRFGYAADDILSFDSGLKMRESTRDILAPVDNDVVLTIDKINDATKIDITTLPLHIYLDLRRLDETFGWFGGFSSMLDLGSSVVSTVTVKNAVSKTSRPMKTSRGVHFETTEADMPGQPTPHEMQNKISARIGGLVFDLRGSQASLRLESTAMKLVSRAEGLGLVVDRLNLSGPYLQQPESEPSIAMKLMNLRVEYLSTPKEADLDRLLGLLSPSKDKYDHDDDILVDTLLRQRRQGGVIRAKVDNLESHISSILALHCFPALAEDLKKLSTVAKYLPEDDRPGILTLASIRDFKFETNVDGEFGSATVVFQNVEFRTRHFPQPNGPRGQDPTPPS